MASRYCDWCGAKPSRGVLPQFVLDEYPEIQPATKVCASCRSKLTRDAKAAS